jgi:hypothetical protein
LDTAVVLTYPGHFYMTMICVRSIRHWYPDLHKIYIIYDDLAGSWPDYEQDLQREYDQWFVKPHAIIPYSELAGIDRCDVGWWRQQLIKTHIDQLVPGETWFVVDGDVIFDESIDVINRTPVFERWNCNNPIDIMVDRYVDRVLGYHMPRVKLDGKFYVTSGIPFRVLDRKQLKSLRNHAEHQLGSAFLSWHINMMATGEIVGFVPEGDRMVMHEWELIEAWNHRHRPGQYLIEPGGNGYHTFTHTSGLMAGRRFRHSSMRDAVVGRQWIEYQSITITDELWHKALHFHKEKNT